MLRRTKWAGTVLLAGLAMAQNALGHTFELKLEGFASFTTSMCPIGCAAGPWTGLLTAETSSAETSETDEA